MEKIEGVVEEIIFHNEGNGYTVLSLKAGAERTTCVGTRAPHRAVPALSRDSSRRLRPRRGAPQT